MFGVFPLIKNKNMLYRRIFLLFFVSYMLNCSLSNAQWQVFDPISNVSRIAAWSDNIAVAGGADQIVYTQNGGSTWNKSTLFLGSASGVPLISSLAFQDANTVFATGRIGNTNSLILKSTDGGNTFTRKPVGLNSELIIQAFGNDTLIAYSGFRILRSLDVGETWTNIPNSISFTSVKFLNSFEGYGFRNVGTTATQLFKTTNGGESWTSIANLSNLTSTEIMLLDNGSMIVKGFESQQFGGFIPVFYVSTNLGVSFTKVAIDGTDYTINFILRKADEKLIAYGVFGRNNDLGFKESTNQGITWSVFQNLGTLFQAAFASASPAQTKTYLGVGGIAQHRYSSSKVEYQTITINPGFGNGGGEIEFLNSTTGFASGSSAYMIKTTNGGQTWIPNVVPNCASVLKHAFPSASNGFAISKPSLFGSVEYNINRSLDSGNTWNAVNFSTLEILNDMEFFDGENGLVSASAGIIYRTTDAGTTWATIQLPTTFGLSGIGYADRNTVLCGGEEGRLFKSVNGGQNWLPITINSIKNIYNINFITPNIGFLLAGAPFLNEVSEIFKTVDGGQSWFLVTNFSNPGPIFDLDFNPLKEGIAVGYDINNVPKEFRYNPVTDTWSSRNLNLTGGFYYNVSFPDSAVAYASGINGGGILNFSIAKNFIERKSINFSLNRTNFCTGNQALVSFVARGFIDSTQFTLQLSNDSGSFATPTSLGTIAVSANNAVFTGTFSALIPGNIPQGLAYRMRIVANTPFESGDNGINIKIGQTAVVEAGEDTSFCVGTSVIQLRNFSPSGGIWIGTGVDSSGRFNVAGTGPGIYNLTYFINGNGCPGSNVKQVVINNKPSFQIVSSPSLCGQSNGTAGVNQSGFLYRWNTGATTRLLTGLAAGSYSVLVTDPSTGCKDSSLVLISDSGNILVSIANIQSRICQNETSLALTATPNTGTWSGTGVSGSSFNPALGNIGPNILVYTLQQSGCSFLRSDTIVVLAVPLVSAGNNRNICIGDPNPTFVGLPTGGIWSGACISSGGTITIPSSSGGNCQVVYAFTSGNSCSATDTASIFFNELPTIPVVSANGSLLSTQNVQGLSYQWLFNGAPISGATNPNFSITGGGSYSVQVRNTFGCFATSQPLVVTQKELLSQISPKISVYPNPTLDQKVIISNQIGLAIKTLKLLNIFGQSVDIQWEHKTPSEITLTKVNPAKGTYFIRIELDNNKTEVKKIIFD